MLPGYLLGATGAGDVKLMAAVGALLGPDGILWAFLYTTIAGGAIALVIAAWRGRLQTTLDETMWLVLDLRRERSGDRGPEGEQPFSVCAGHCDRRGVGGDDRRHSFVICEL